MDTYTAYACGWDPGRRTFELLILRDSDQHEVWGDQPLQAASFDDIPRAAGQRLVPPVRWRPQAGAVWERFESRTGTGWRAPAELAGNG